MNSITILLGHKTKNTHNALIMPCAIFLSVFTLSFIAGSFITHPQTSKAVTGLNLVGPTTMNLASNTAALDLGSINPTSTGAFTSGSHTLTAATNVPTGYQLSLNTTSAPTLPVAPGTTASPAALANNTWGYSLAGGTDTPIWAGPTTTPTTIKSTANSTTGDTTTVYYGAKVDTSLASGTYLNTVRYTATANIASVPAPAIISITPNTGTTAGGTAIQIVGTGFTVNDQSITTGVTVAGQACTNVSISSNTPATGQDTIYCNTPSRPTAGAVDIAVTTWSSTVTSANSYTYIPPTPIIATPIANQIFNAGTTSITLSATTNMNAICYYGTAAGAAIQMATTGGTTHSQSITSLANNSTNTRYIRCQAATGHSYGPEVSVTFYIRAATPAAPSLSPANGSTVSTGTTTITVTSAGATCTWGTSAVAATNASGTTRNTTVGTNTLYYSCIAGSGNTASAATTGNWSYTGQSPIAQTGEAIQTVTTARCPTTRTRVYDVRDGATYWIQKLADGRCWMLTNLAYGGGGNNTYGDVKNINLNSTNSGTTYTSPEYYNHPGSNRTTGTTDPSTSTSGIGQYGYLYNWCAATGVQIGTNSCARAETPTPNINRSICPSGWRLPTGGPGSEFVSVVSAIGATDSVAGSTALRSTFLAMYSGYWINGFYFQGSRGYFWSASPYAASSAYAMYYATSEVTSAGTSDKTGGFAVRCIAF